MRHKFLWDFEIQTDHLISARRLVIVKKKKEKKTSSDSKKKKEKKRTCRLVDFAILANHRVKLKESEKRYKCPNLRGKYNSIHSEQHSKKY